MTVYTNCQSDAELSLGYRILRILCTHIVKVMLNYRLDTVMGAYKYAYE